MNERLSQAKEYLTRDDILDVLLDEDGNLNLNLTNDKELEVWDGVEQLTFDWRNKEIVEIANKGMQKTFGRRRAQRLT